MGRFCYCSKILTGKTNAVIKHWAKKNANFDDALIVAEELFWNTLEMTGFESWLQPTPKGDFMIHCIEGTSLQRIFEGFREQVAAQNPITLQLQAFYLEVLGKNYAHKSAEPQIECLLDLSLAPFSSRCMKKGFVYPLLPNKERDYRKFGGEAMDSKKARQLAMLKAFHVSHITTWLQNTPDGTFVVIYTERQTHPPTPVERLAQGKDSLEWKEISKELMECTGLTYEALSPDVQWLTEKTLHYA